MPPFLQSACLLEASLGVLSIWRDVQKPPHVVDHGDAVLTERLAQPRKKPVQSR